jgi:Cu-Zn family superoxide dismutase
MSRLIAFVSTSTLAVLLLVAACSKSPEENQTDSRPSTTKVVRAIVKLQGTKDNEHIEGTVTFSQQADGVLVEATVQGLTPGKHGFHVHALGDVTCADGLCTEGHWDPTKKPHAGPDAEERHHGDLGNVTAGEDGKATYKRTDKVLQLNGPHSIVGRSIIIHADPDDFTSQPTGNAGARIAQGVIGILEEK